MLSERRDARDDRKGAAGLGIMMDENRCGLAAD